MKFRINVRHTNETTGWWEEYSKDHVNTLEEAETVGATIVQGWNDTLRPERGEKTREFICAELIHIMTIVFLDLGQDFLWWEITNGIVTDCAPFQASHWCERKVYSENLKVGDCITISSHDCTDRMTIKYPITEIHACTLEELLKSRE